MPDLGALGIDRAVGERMCEGWTAGASKSALERPRTESQALRARQATTR